MGANLLVGYMITLLFHYQLCSRFDFFQATGPKGEADIEQAAKRPKVGITADVGKVANPKSSNPTPMEELHAEMTDKNKCVENVVSCSPKTSTTMVLQQSTSLKQLSIRPLGSIGTPSPVNRYKLDNRPTAFRILPPLPAGFANVSLSLSPPPLKSFPLNRQKGEKLLLHFSISE